MRRALLATALLFAPITPIHAQVISDDPNSMWFDMTFDELNDYDKLFAQFTYAQIFVLHQPWSMVDFPCEIWSPNFWPSPLVIDPSVVVDWTPLPPDHPPPCLNCDPPPVVNVPETGTWLMGLIGIASLGLFGRWRRT